MPTSNGFYPDSPADSWGERPGENDSIVTPPGENFDTDAMRGSMQQMLSDNLGQFVVCEFMIGSGTLVRKEGVLYNVGRSYLTLYEEINMHYVVCDIFSIKFVTFYPPGRRPRSSSRLSSSMPLPPRQQ